MDRPPPGRSMAELRAIVAADTARWERLAEAWNSMTEAEQEALVKDAEGLTEGRS